MMFSKQEPNLEDLIAFMERQQKAIEVQEQLLEEQLKSLEKLQEHLDRLSKTCPTYPTYLTSNTDYIPDACKSCSNHPSNGGSGICHCILGLQTTC